MILTMVINGNQEIDIQRHEHRWRDREKDKYLSIMNICMFI